MEATISFNNGSGNWVSRYSYTPSCIGWIKDQMITAPKSTQFNSVLWKHDKSSDTYNKFYDGSATPSSVSLSFNANPSANKIYKAFSLETPDISAIDGVNTFITNNGSIGADTRRPVRVNRLMEKGGILYGGIEGVRSITATNVLSIGVVDQIVEQEDGKFFLKISGPKSQYSGGDARIVRPGQLDLVLFEQFSGYIVEESRNDGYIVNTIFEGSDDFELFEGTEVLLVYLDINHDQPKGQFADVSVSFGNGDFEVHALNLDFEFTDLDHNR